MCSFHEDWTVYVRFLWSFWKTQIVSCIPIVFFSGQLTLFSWTKINCRKITVHAIELAELRNLLFPENCCCWCMFSSFKDESDTGFKDNCDLMSHNFNQWPLKVWFNLILEDRVLFISFAEGGLESEGQRMLFNTRTWGPNLSEYGTFALLVKPCA